MVFKPEDGWELLTVAVRVGEPLDGEPWGATHRWSRGTSPVVWLMEGGREENKVPAWGVLTVLPSSSLEERSRCLFLHAEGDFARRGTQ